MIKNILKKTGSCVFLLLRIAILIFLFLWFCYDSVIVFPAPQLYALVVYYSIMLLCIFAFIATFFKRFRRKGYILFGGAMIIYCGLWFNFVPIIDQHGADRCLDSEQGVWDYDRHECRQDCWRWDKEHGCYKDE